MKLKSSQMILGTILLALCLFLTYNSTYFMSERFAFSASSSSFARGEKMSAKKKEGLVGEIRAMPSEPPEREYGTWPQNIERVIRARCKG